MSGLPFRSPALVLGNMVESKGNPDIEYIWTFIVFID